MERERDERYERDVMGGEGEMWSAGWPTERRGARETVGFLRVGGGGDAVCPGRLVGSGVAGVALLRGWVAMASADGGCRADL
jgi:hypothetical protein